MTKAKNLLAAMAVSAAALTSTAMADTSFTQNATPAEHLAVVDALHRFAWGMDTDDGSLIASAFTEDGIADFSPAAKRLGIQFPMISGRDNILGGLVPFAAGLITTHTIGNARVYVTGDTAKLRALVEAQQISVKDQSRFVLLKNDYTVDLARDGETWKIKSMSIDNIWKSGDIKVITGE